MTICSGFLPPNVGRVSEAEILPDFVSLPVLEECRVAATIIPASAGFQRDTRSGKYSMSSMINEYKHENHNAPGEKAED